MEILFKLGIISIGFIPLMVIMDVILREKLIYKYNHRSLFLNIVRKIMILPLIAIAIIQAVLYPSILLIEGIWVIGVLMAYIYPLLLIIEGVVLLKVRNKSECQKS